MLGLETYQKSALFACVDHPEHHIAFCDGQQQGSFSDPSGDYTRAAGFR
jgi:hypothetical protein